MISLLILLVLCFFGFPKWMRMVKGRQVGWKCEVCGRRFSQGWMIEFHHIYPTYAGGKDTFDNMQALCLLHHYEAHLELRAKGIDHPNSASLVKARLDKSGGRTDRWLKKNAWK